MVSGREEADGERHAHVALHLGRVEHGLAACARRPPPGAAAACRDRVVLAARELGELATLLMRKGDLEAAEPLMQQHREDVLGPALQRARLCRNDTWGDWVESRSETHLHGYARDELSKGRKVVVTARKPRNTF